MSILQLLVVFAILQFASTLRAAEPAADPAKAPLRILFAGSSSTYWNDLPGEVAKLVSGEVAGHVGRPVTAEIVGRSGDDIRVYLEPGFARYQYGVKPGETFLDKIREEKPDIVVLQTVCSFIMSDASTDSGENAHSAAITRYCYAIRASGGEPMFYEMGWGKRELESEGRNRILKLAKSNRVRLYAPCSSAWARVYAERPDMLLQHPRDNSHPGDLGHFLNLACFYAAITGSSPEGKLPRKFHVWPHLSKVEKESQKSALHSAYQDFRPDPYQATLPEWMRRNAGAGLTASVSEADAQYLERIAYSTYITFQTALSTTQTE